MEQRRRSRLECDDTRINLIQAQPRLQARHFERALLGQHARETEMWLYSSRFLP
jgi:hypothetical protein